MLCMNIRHPFNDSSSPVVCMCGSFTYHFGHDLTRITGDHDDTGDDVLLLLRGMVMVMVKDQAKVSTAIVVQNKKRYLLSPSSSSSSAGAANLYRKERSHRRIMI